MRKAFAYLFILASIISSCREDRLDRAMPDTESRGLSVYVAVGDPETKATVTNPGNDNGEEGMNENIIRTLDFFFFPKGSESGSATPYNHRFIADAGDVNNTWDWTESLEDRSFIESIFGTPLTNGAECEAYVIVNLWDVSGGNRVSKFANNWNSQTHATLRSTVISASDSEKGFNRVGREREQQFVMEGSNLITLNVRGGRYFVEGEVPVYRAAAKMRLQVTVPEDIIADGVEDAAGFTWTPVVEQMKVILVNGVNKSYVCAFDESYKYNPVAADVFPSCYYSSQELWWDNYAHNMVYNGQTSWEEENPDTHVVETKTGKVYEHEVPFYSYRTKNWKGEANAANEAYMILLLPWKRDVKPSGSSVPYLYTNTYYQIPIAQDHTAPEYYLKSNRYYRQEVTVSILGSFQIEDLVELETNTFIILDWNTQDLADPTVSNVTMTHTSFLAVSSNSVEMNNVSSASVQYSSSHTITANFTKIEFYSYYDSGSTDRFLRVVYERQKNNGALTNTWYRRVYDGYTGTEVTGNGYNSNNAGDPLGSAVSNNNTYKGFPLGGYTISVNETTGLITMNHEISNTQFSPATITVEVTNTAITTPEVITFEQYPAIYITGTRSNGYVFVNGTGQGNNVISVYDDRNNNNGRIGSLSPRSGVSGQGGTNDNRNLYTIHISSFSAGSSYILGDPRTPDAVALDYLSGTSVSGTAMYHPTQSLYTGTYGQDDTENMISPEFLIASSYGAVRSGYYMSYDQAKKRCAAYQEAGYPAGRWRMPTKAEVLYMMELSRGTKIPSLFYFTGNNDSEGYWCANGKVVTSGGKLQLANNNTTTAVRCVYDVWYWGADPVQANATSWLGYRY